MIAQNHPSPGLVGDAVRRLLTALLLLTGLAAEAVPVSLSPADTEGKWGKELQVAAELALDQAEARLGLKLDHAVEILTLPNVLDFEAYLGGRLPHVVAVARPERCQIVINRHAWLGGSRTHQQQVLIHEMTHLIVGRRVKGRLPAWLDEGLAMLVAGDQGFTSGWRVLIAGSFDTLIPVALLMDRITIGEGSQTQAYAQSLSLTRFYIRQQFPEHPDDPSPLVRMLADPTDGPRRVKLLWDPILIASLEYRWRHSWYVIWAMVIFLTGSSFLWMGMSLLFLVAWWRKRRQARMLRERLEADDEDAWTGDAEVEQPWEEEEEPRSRPWEQG